MSTIVTVPLLGALIGCQQGPQVVTSIVFDGESRSITTTDVFCTNQLNGGLVILVQDNANRSGSTHAAGPTRGSKGGSALWRHDRFRG